MESAEKIARDYLAAVEARDLPRAKAFLAEGMEMIFPGGKRPPNLEQLVANSSGRYQRIGKTIDGVDLCPAGDLTIAYCYGRLHGIWPDGEAFEGIRFIDRFEIRDGKIQVQWVWNDSGEHRLAREGNT